MIKSSKLYIEVQTNPKIFPEQRVKKKQNIWHVLETWSYCLCGHKPTLCYGFWKETNKRCCSKKKKDKETMIMYGTDKNPDWEKKTQTHHHDNICGVKDQSTESTNHHLVSEVRWSLWDWPEEEIRLKENDQNRKGRRRIQYHTHTRSESRAVCDFFSLFLHEFAQNRYKVMRDKKVRLKVTEEECFM